MVGDWTPPSRIAALITESKMANRPKPESDLAQHAAFFERHPEFFVNALKEAKTMDTARTEYTAFVLSESDRLREKITQLENKIEALQDGAEPLKLNYKAAVEYDTIEDDEGDDITYKAEWQSNKPLRKEFGGSYKAYAAYRAAEKAGLIRSHSNRG